MGTQHPSEQSGYSTPCLSRRVKGCKLCPFMSNTNEITNKLSHKSCYTSEGELELKPTNKVFQQGVLHVRFLRVVMACVFDPLLPGVCLHLFACFLSHTIFRPYFSFFFVSNSFIFRIILLFLLLFAS